MQLRIQGHASKDMHRVVAVMAARWPYPQLSSTFLVEQQQLLHQLASLAAWRRLLARLGRLCWPRGRLPRPLGAGLAGNLAAAALSPSLPSFREPLLASRPCLLRAEAAHLP